MNRYRAAAFGAFWRRIVGWAMGTTPKTRPVRDAVNKAQSASDPAEQPWSWGLRIDRHG
ncbi:MAG: hypothetical protein AAF982_06000 [Pseudomonadota bacterium]